MTTQQTEAPTAVVDAAPIAETPAQLPAERGMAQIEVVTPQAQTPLALMLDTAARAGDLGQVLQIAGALAKTNLVPTAYRGKPESILVAYELGAAVGLPLMAAVQNIAEINGRPSLYGDGLLAVVKARGGVLEEEPIVEDGTGEIIGYRCTAHREGHAPVVREFTRKDAEKAGLWEKDGPWKNYPIRMMQMRARGFACRDQYPDWLSGMTPAEEAFDYIEINADGGVSQGRASSTPRRAGAAGVLDQSRSRRPAPTPVEGAPVPTEAQIKAELETAQSIPDVNATQSVITANREALGEAVYGRCLAAARARVRELAGSKDT